MRWTDTHIHLIDFFNKGTLPEIFARAKAASVGRMMTISTAEEDWVLSQKIATEADSIQVDYTLGIHPCYVQADWSLSIEKMEAFLKDSKGLRPLAIGEVGLDSFHLPEDEEKANKLLVEQIRAFEAQIDLAERYHLPLVVHSRGQFDKVLSILDASRLDPKRILFHCFVEGPSAMQAIVDRGMWASFTGIITYKNAESVRESLALMGPERLMLETDAPYLSPVPHRGKINEPAYLLHTAEIAAQILGIPLSLLSEKTQKAVSIFWGDVRH